MVYLFSKRKYTLLFSKNKIFSIPLANNAPAKIVLFVSSIFKIVNILYFCRERPMR